MHQCREDQAVILKQRARIKALESQLAQQAKPCEGAVEEVAKAIYCDNESYVTTSNGWNSTSALIRDRYRCNARAAIAAYEASRPKPVITSIVKCIGKSFHAFECKADAAKFWDERVSDSAYEMTPVKEWHYHPAIKSEASNGEETANNVG